jgi:alanyl-tRNA synthetase
LPAAAIGGRPIGEYNLLILGLPVAAEPDFARGGVVMRGAEIRKTFLDFFAERGHRVVRSSPLVPVGDPTLLFTNAGMNQFKDVFLGREARDYARAASAQKCLRVSGKHNDLEEVGRTARHHTFFEMLGNFSFGDYFKAEAIEFAWDLVTRVYGVDPSRLTATVFGGEDGVPADEEAAKLWSQRAGLPEERILRLGASENFWKMGDTGPCGPCSEMHYDQGADLGCGRPDCSGPACDCDRFSEIWNLVFMQFDQRVDGTLAPLPAPSIDTGMGLERMAAVLQGKTSNYQTDLFRPLMEAVAESCGVAPGVEGVPLVSLQVISDHLRAIAFLVADGIIPSNEGRGYVLRRILRRAFRHGRLLGRQGPFLHRLSRVVVDEMGSAYPELEAARTVIDEVCRAEEERFEETLDESLKLLEASFRAHEGKRRIPGAELFRLYDTFGLPLDLAEEMARERGYGLDREGFEAALEAQRKRARESWQGGGGGALDRVHADLAGRGLRSTFLGYEAEEAEGTVLALVAGGEETTRLSAGESGEVLLDRTSLYAEAGGQVGERGELIWDGGRAAVSLTLSPVPGMIVHQVNIAEGELEVGRRVTVRSDPGERRATRRNHTATHLLHAALRNILGAHVKQAGSLVAPDRLRFDFTHYRPLSASRIREIEDLVNAQILGNRPVETRIRPLEEALESGAVALFGEKYDERVRVVSVPGFSTELCGGLHCSATGDIGVFKVLSERGISAGVRRLEAVTGLGALARFQAEEDTLAGLAERLGVPRDDLLVAAEKLVRRQKDLQREVERLRLKMAGGTTSGETDRVESVDGLKVLARRIEDLDRSQMRQLADSLRSKADVVVLGTQRENRVALLVAVNPEASKRVPARRVIDRLARICGGGGGGKDTLAEAGGRDPSKLDQALGMGGEVVREILAGSGSR